MATFVLTDASVTVTGVDLSNHGTNVAISYEAEAVDATAFGDGTRINAGGLKNWSMSTEFNQDFAASSVDATFFPLVGTTVAVAVRADSTGVGATNPSYNGTGLVQSYNPFPGGAVGDMAKATVEIVGAGTLARSVS